MLLKDIDCSGFSASRCVCTSTKGESAETGAPETALESMLQENAARIIFMPPPFTSDDPARYDADAFLPCIKAIGGDKPMDLSTVYAEINGLSQCLLRQKCVINRSGASSVKPPKGD